MPFTEFDLLKISRVNLTTMVLVISTEVGIDSVSIIKKYGVL